MLDTTSNELLFGLVGTAIGSHLSRLDKGPDWDKAEAFLNKPLPKLNQDKFNSSICGRRLLTHPAIVSVIKIAEAAIAGVHGINVNKLENVDLSKLSKIAATLEITKTTNKGDTKSQKIINNTTAGAQVIGSLIIGGLTYATLGPLGLYTCIDEVLAGSYTWLLGVIRNKIFKRIEKKQDEITANTPATIGYTLQNVSILYNTLCKLTDKQMTAYQSSGVCDIRDEPEDEDIWDKFNTLVDIHTRLSYMCYGCVISLMGIIDTTKE